ncbi:hypothetical protein PR048_018802 [Dryococelus australis]|uniref:DDE-1 domain-containing protein n=1 Tax=Dryococelus australis TaxID=614101 RepID=A0ABQ9H1S6_9NEOP|nr:hypothetical protein PR048_018802 [Dryococelus australis]
MHKMSLMQTNVVSFLICYQTKHSPSREINVMASHKKPRLKNVKSLPCVYKTNMSSWMKCKILDLFGQKNSFHGPVQHTLKNVHVEFLPTNTTSVIQPLNQGIIETVKQHLVSRLTTKTVYSVALLDAIHADRIMGFHEPRNNCKLFWEGRFQHRQKNCLKAWEDNLLPCQVQEIENLCKSNDAPKPVTCSEAMQHLEAYSPYLSSVPDVPENIMKNLKELKY